jgi:S-adenosylmethionine decarboxylase
MQNRVREAVARVETRRERGSGGVRAADAGGLRPAAPVHRFVERDGLRFAGTHLIVDLWQARNLDDAGAIEAALRAAVEAAGATLLTIDLHRFDPTGGVTGVAVLAESHISIHTWPESGYAAVDVFMCGQARPHDAIAVLRRAFEPGMISVVEHRRGLMP